MKTWKHICKKSTILNSPQIQKTFFHFLSPRPPARPPSFTEGCTLLYIEEEEKWYFFLFMCATHIFRKKKKGEDGWGVSHCVVRSVCKILDSFLTRGQIFSTFSTPCKFFKKRVKQFYVFPLPPIPVPQTGFALTFGKKSEKSCFGPKKTHLKQLCIRG